ncbi:MAG TPA: hypothetical protein PKE55_00915 [Kiritimatiellia bacterium]|nr:hypothetical protein [Kiritimatiellia bacterium]
MTMTMDCRKAFAGLVVALMLIPSDGQAWFGRNREPAGEETTGHAVPVKAGQGPGAITVQEEGQPALRFVTRAHMRMESEEAEAEFMQFAMARSRATEDLTVISRLIEEKQLEVARFNASLRDEFAINPDENYQFDEDSGTIYQLVARQALTENTMVSATPEAIEELFEKNVFMTVANPEERERFIRLVAARQLSTEQIRVLSLLEQEKEMELAILQQVISERYSVSMDRDYRYDPDTRTLFELIPVPAGFDRAGEGTTPGASQPQGQ